MYFHRVLQITFSWSEAQKKRKKTNKLTACLYRRNTIIYWLRKFIKFRKSWRRNDYTEFSRGQGEQPTWQEQGRDWVSLDEGTELCLSSIFVNGTLRKHSAKGGGLIWSLEIFLASVFFKQNQNMEYLLNRWTFEFFVAPSSWEWSVWFASTYSSAWHERSQSSTTSQQYTWNSSWNWQFSKLPKCKLGVC